MREFTQEEDRKIILLTEKGYTHRGIAKVFDCDPMDVIKRQFWLRQIKKLRK